MKFLDFSNGAPSERVQIESLLSLVSSFKYIKEPSEEVQLAAVQKDGRVIRWIDEPSLRVQLEAVQQNGCAIRYIDEPSERVQQAAVDNFPHSVIIKSKEEITIGCKTMSLNEWLDYDGEEYKSIQPLLKDKLLRHFTPEVW